jgi:EAL domain-containing protein (putative c-di-GMP-specific phosphodiesterase class I)
MLLAQGRLDGLEALVRWHHPQHGVIPPSDFIPLAEHSGLIRPLTRWVLERSIQDCRHLRGDGFDFGVAVNLSARALHDPDLPKIVSRLVVEADLPPSCLTLEITESVIMAEPERAMAVLGRLREIGVRISIDDFGTGYSSLAYLRQLRVDELKIDQSFVMDLDQNEDNGFIVRSVIELGHNLGLEVVAEGVENQTTLHILTALGCDRVQGYELSRPLAFDRLQEWLDLDTPPGATTLTSEALSR